MTTTLLALDKIRLDGGTQSRAQLDEATIADYGAAIEAGEQFPPVIVYHDGESIWLADGFHRVHGHRRANRSQIEAEVRQGTRRDAILYSVRANATHGLRRTNADKRRGVMMLVEDPEWGTMSDRWVGDACGVSDRFVAMLRRESGANRSHVTGRDGKTYPVPPPKAEPRAKSAPATAKPRPEPTRVVLDRTEDPIEVEPEHVDDYSQDPDAPRQLRGHAIAQGIRSVVLRQLSEWPAGESFEPLLEVLAELLPLVEARQARRAA